MEKRIEKVISALPLKVIYEYRYLESRVHRIIDRFCNPFCKLCTCCCCKKEICDESIDSFWLKLIWTSSDYKISDYHDHAGWLTEYGCRLSVGRPPICYDFFCNYISDYISVNADCLIALRKIAHLVAFSGKNAIGTKHLVTLTANEIFHNLNYERLSDSIAKSLEILNYYENMLLYPSVPASGL